jgi:hypothetical protein
LFENRVLRRIFGSERVEMTGECRKLNNDKLNVLYFSTNIVRLIKTKRMRLAEHVTSVGRVDVHTGFLVGKRRERDYLEDPAAYVSLTLSWIFRKWNGWHGLD